MIDIEAEQARAKEIAQRQSIERAGSMSARFPNTASAKRRAAFFNIISGTAAGTAAAQGAIQRGDALSAAILGAGGALQAPTFEQVEAQKQAELAKAKLSSLEAMPLDRVSPGLAKELADLGYDVSDMSIGAVKSMGPLIEDATQRRREKLERFQKFEQEEEKKRTTGLGIEENLRNKHLALSDEFRTTRDSFSRIQEVAKTVSAASDLALIYNFMRINDPKSTVRESEFRSAEQAKAWLSRMDSEGVVIPSNVRTAIQKAKPGDKGAFLIPEQRADFVSTAQNLFNSQKRINDQLDENFRDLAVAAQVNPNSVVIPQGLPGSGGNKSGGLKPGDIRKGYRYKGGDPSQQESWEKP